MTLLQKWIWIGIWILLIGYISARDDAAPDENAAPSPTIASILVNFMADLAEQKLSKKVTRKEPGNFYNGRYYWLGSRFYKGSKGDNQQCTFPTPERFLFVYAKDGARIAEIIYECNNGTETCCEATCCALTTTAAPKTTSTVSVTCSPAPAAPAPAEAPAPAPPAAGANNTAAAAPPPAPAAPAASGGAGGGGGLSMPSLIGIGVAVVLVLVCICTIACCCCCRRGKKKVTGGKKKGPNFKPGYGTMAKFALKSPF